MSSGQGPLNSPRDVAPSPRSRAGFDGVLGGGDSWIARRKAAEALSRTTSSSYTDLGGESEKGIEIKEEQEEHLVPMDNNPSGSLNGLGLTNGSPGDPSVQLVAQPSGDPSLGGSNTFANGSGGNIPNFAHPSPPQMQADLANVEWSYLDPQNNVQGAHCANLDP